MAERRLPAPEDYPNNSHAARERQKAEEERPKKAPPQKVTKGAVRQRKKPFGRRFAEAFGAPEGQGVIDYILYDIIIPATKNMIVDSIIDGAEMAILGEVRGRRRRPGDRNTRYAYDRVSYRGDDYRRDRDRRDDHYDREDRRARSAMRDYEDIIFDTKSDADEVIGQMVELIEVYGQVTIGDLYDLAGLTPEYTVGNYGWTNLRDASPRRIRDGYILDLPRPVLL